MQELIKFDKNGFYIKYPEYDSIVKSYFVSYQSIAIIGGINLKKYDSSYYCDFLDKEAKTASTVSKYLSFNIHLIDKKTLEIKYPIEYNTKNFLKHKISISDVLKKKYTWSSWIFKDGFVSNPKTYMPNKFLQQHINNDKSEFEKLRALLISNFNKWKKN